MRVLFICSGNSGAFETVPFIRSQGDSLTEEGVSVSYFPLKGKGLGGYLKNVPKLFWTFRKERYDVVHAHYGFSAFVALMALPFRPVVVSFMGSDAYGKFDLNGRPERQNLITRVVARIVERWADHLIVKSPNIRSCFSADWKISLIPNGVNLERFAPSDKLEARQKLGLKIEGKKVLFLGDVGCVRKNFKLCEEAVRRTGREIEILMPYPVSHHEVALYLAAADTLVLSSRHEGSPNVVKEAMACGCPVVSTPVGDVRWLLEGVSGSRVVEFDPDDMAAAIIESLSFTKRTNGRERLVELKLDSRSVARRLLEIYAGLIAGRRQPVESVIAESEGETIREGRQI